MKIRSFLAGITLFDLPLALPAQVPFNVYETGFEDSGELFGNFPLGTASGINGWSFSGTVVTNTFAAPGGGTQSMFVDGVIGRRQFTTKGAIDTNVVKISFDLLTPVVRTNDFSILFGGQGIELLVRNNNRIQATPSSGPLGDIVSGGFFLATNIWYTFEFFYLNPGSDLLQSLRISTNGVQVFSNGLNAVGTQFGRTLQPNSTNIDIFFFSSGNFSEPVGNGYGLYFDNISILAIPEPSAALFLLMAGAVGACLRQRKRS